MYYLRCILNLIVYNFAEPSYDLDTIWCTIYYDKNIIINYNQYFPIKYLDDAYIMVVQYNL